MSPSLSNAGRRAFATTAAVFALFLMAVGLSGCPGAAELENPERFTVLAGSNAGGTGPTGGAGPMGGSGGSGQMNCNVVLPTLDCDWKAALGGPGQSPAGYCSKGGCHNTSVHAGGLDLTPNDLLVSRLLNKPAKHQITCAGGAVCMSEPPPGTCEACGMCAPGSVLIDTANPGQGWVFDKINGFIPGTTTTTESLGCGDKMPTFNTTGTGTYTQAHKDCLIKFFTELAKTPGTWPCGDDSGAGGSGTGGTSAAGAGAGGAGTAGSGGTGGT